MRWEFQVIAVLTFDLSCHLKNIVYSLLHENYFLRGTRMDSYWLYINSYSRLAIVYYSTLYTCILIIYNYVSCNDVFLYFINVYNIFVQ